MHVENHLLFAGEAPVPYRPAADLGPVMAAPPALIVAHYSAGASYASAIDQLTRRDKTYVSAHLMISRAGEITQLAPFNRVAWHAGVSEWPRGDPSLTDLNKHSIGIEFANFGRLERRPGGAAFTWFGVEVPADEVEISRGQGADSFWHRYTAPQLAAGLAACRALAAAYPRLGAIAGHSEVALPPGRKIDPGPLFPMAMFRRQIFAGPPPPVNDNPPRRRSWLARLFRCVREAR